MYVKLANYFHGTTTQIRFPSDSKKAFFTYTQARRVRNRLCGVKGCDCSSALGTRGCQDYIEIDGVDHFIVFYQYPDGVQIVLHELRNYNHC